ncbi:hypothetical protein ABZY68_34295 [Streptomyces sp. NPDC006482]|uniref:hypothetical protein n=1 Tax=Streptomyces sp. NPDC006482 TaxID=3154306 RepID=UPI0033B58A1F
MSPGPFARYGVRWPKGMSRSFTNDVRTKIDNLGRTHGCHRCGAKTPGGGLKRFIPNHWPAVSINKRWGGKLKTLLLPHCSRCSLLQ